MKTFKHSEINWAKLIDLANKLIGKSYVFGSEVDVTNPNPDDIKAIDCSELSEWLFAQIGLVLPDGSYNQIKMCKDIKGELLIGDLGFKADPETSVVHHVGIFLGNNEVIEAKGKSYGVVKTPISTYMASTHFYKWGRLKCIEDA